MSLPAIRGTTNNSVKTAAGADGTIVLPTVVAGDTILLFCDNASTTTFSTPTGYVALNGATFPGTSSGGGAWIKQVANVADSGATVTIPMGGTSSNYVATAIVFVGPCVLLNATEATDTTSLSAHAVPSVTFVADVAFVVEHVYDKSSAPGTAWTPPSGYTVEQQVYQTGTGSITTATGVSNSIALTSPQGGDTYTQTVATTQAGKWSIAFSPAPSGGGTATGWLVA